MPVSNQCHFRDSNADSEEIVVPRDNAGSEVLPVRLKLTYISLISYFNFEFYIIYT